MIVSYYKSINEPKLKDAELKNILKTIGSNYWKIPIEEIRNCLLNSEDDKASKLKSKLPAFTVSATFNKSRTQKHLDNYSSVIHLDYDKVDNLSQVKQSLCKIKYTYCVFVSPSGNGLKVFVRVDSKSENHKEAFNSLREYYDTIVGVDSDKSVKDVTRLCFISYDPDLYINSEAPMFNFYNYMEMQKTVSTTRDVDELWEFTSNVDSFHNGNRNNFIYKLSCNAIRWGIEKEDLVSHYSYKTDTTFTLKELQDTVNSAYHNNYDEFDSLVKPINYAVIKNDSIKKLDTPKKKRSLLKAEPINEGLKRSYLQPNPRKLFGQFWWENELVVCFASTNVGKTLLAMQIAESLATGTQVFDHKDNPCPNETKAMKVLYIDAELTYKQIENRYKSSETGENYILSHNIIRAHIDRDFEWKKGDNMEELVKVDIRDLIELHEPEALIVDNLKMLKSGTEKSQEALPMMFDLKNLKGKYNISILALGHTPKIDLLSPIQINHLSGSSDIANACDGIFAIAKTKEDNSNRYIKELKQRNVEFRFGANNVLLCTIEQPDSFTGFTFNSLVKEVELLNKLNKEAENNLEKLIIKFHSEGISSREISEMIPYGKSKVAQIIKEKCPSKEDSKDTKDKVDSLDKGKQLNLDMSEVSTTSKVPTQSLVDRQNKKL